MTLSEFFIVNLDELAGRVELKDRFFPNAIVPENISAGKPIFADEEHEAFIEQVQNFMRIFI
ncbi:MAG: hypothetical protein AB9907_01975 [Flexilinea sp.]